MPRLLSPEDLEAKKAAMERYNKAFNEAHGYYPGVTPLKKRGGRQKREEMPTKPAKETPEQWRDRMVMQYKLIPLQEASVPAYDVTNPARYQRPPAFKHPANTPLLKNVKRNGDDIEENGIDPAEFKRWRLDHLGMTPEQLGAVIRVHARTIRHWEAGKSRIPFMMYWAMQHLKPSDLPTGYDPAKPTRYYKPAIQDHGNVSLKRVLDRYAHAMKPQGVTSGDFEQWRKSYMLMTQEQMAQFLRVPVGIVMNWEAGLLPIPFSIWWVMHTLMQDPEVFLSRPGFHDLYIEYRNGENILRSSRYPEIRFTPADLYLATSALKSVESLNRDIREKDKEIQELQAENTRLRQMLKAGTVAAELKAMHAHIGQLMEKIHTADVLDFPEATAPAADVIPLKQASA
jgi:DNA-binding transcriptional regulator YiaG